MRTQLSWERRRLAGFRLDYHAEKDIALHPRYGILQSLLSERSSAWLEHLVWDQDVAGSNPVAPTISPIANFLFFQFSYPPS